MSDDAAKSPEADDAAPSPATHDAAESPATDALRTRFREARCHHVVIEDFVTDAKCAELRAQIDAGGFATYDEPDRGRFEINREHREAALFDELRALAAQLLERPLREVRAHWLRFRHRHYALMKSDARERIEGTHIEVLLDFSERVTEQAETVYSDGRESWVVPQRPRSVCVVEREPWLYRYERYLNLETRDAIVYRLRLGLVAT